MVLSWDLLKYLQVNMQISNQKKQTPHVLQGWSSSSNWCHTKPAGRNANPAGQVFEKGTETKE